MMSAGGFDDNYGRETDARRAAATPRLESAVGGSAATAGPEAGKPTLDAKIEDARKQGREFLARGIEKVKEKITQLKARIKALSGAIAKVAEDAVAEAFTVPVRIENAVDAMQQKIADAEAAMKARVEEAKARFEARKKELITFTKAAIEKIKDRSGNFFSTIRESLFTSGRRQEMQDLVDMLSQFIANSERSGVTITPAQFDAVLKSLQQISDNHRTNGRQLQELMNTFFNQPRRTSMVLAAA